MYWRAFWVLTSSIWLVSADEKPCTLHHKGNFYDLNPLKATSKDYEFRTAGDHLFAINLCRSPVRETFGLNDVDSPDISGFVRRDHGDFSIGALNTTLTIEDSRPRITMTKGSRCRSKSGDNQIRASTVIEFVCDTSVIGNGKPRLMAQLPPGDDDDACAFFMEWRTGIACPTSESGGVLSFLWYLILNMIAFALLYLAAGTVYNRYVLQLRGVDQIPQCSLESMKYHASEAIDWLKDLAGGMRSGGAYNRTSSGSYHAELPSHRTPTSTGINPISHQTQTSGGGGFVRPQPRGPSTTGKMNPVSHQAQSTVPPLPSTLGRSAPPPPPKQKPRPAPMNLESTAEEREFMLGDDEGEVEDEEASEPAIPTQLAVPPQAANVPPTVGAATTQAGAASAKRGGAVGPDGSIRL